MKGKRDETAFEQAAAKRRSLKKKCVARWSMGKIIGISIRSGKSSGFNPISVAPECERITEY
jgi:hypothetical protein